MLRYPKYSVSMTLPYRGSETTTRTIAGLNLPDDVGSSVGTALMYIAYKYSAVTRFQGDGSISVALITREEANY